MSQERTDQGDPVPPSEASTLTSAPSSGGHSDHIGPYRLVQKVGEGGMGEVWRAEQLEPLRRRVALKIVKLGMDTKLVIARFEQERQALALMDHPFVAKVFDAGATPEGRPYFVMEYVQGLPINEHCDRHELSTVERLGLFVQVCEGVQHAHQKAIIHRDLKPSNVLVTMQEDRAVPKIIDFGVAKATARRLTDASLFTEAGVLVGTPGYMSPEQADLTSGDVDTRADVYSLGVILYELLVGVLPFELRELRRAGLETSPQRSGDLEAPRPSARLMTLGPERSTASARRRCVDVSTLRRLLRGDLDAITMRALEKDRTRRYGSPSDLAADVSRYLRHEPVIAGPPSATYRARKFVRRHRFGVVAATLGVLVPIAFLSAIAVQARRIAREAESKARVAEFLQGLFKVSDPGEARGNSITARELLDRSAATIRDSLTDDPRVRADLATVMGTVYMNLGLYTQAEPLLRDGWETRRRLLGAEDPDTLLSARGIAKLQELRGRYSEAEGLYRQVLEARQRVLGPDHVETLETMNDLANTYRIQGRYQEAEGLHREAVEISRRVLGADHSETLTILNGLANDYTAQGRYQEAGALHGEGFEIRKRVLGPDHPDTLRSMNNLANAYSRQGHFQEAEALNHEALEIRQRVLGPEHPDTLKSMTNLANTYSRQNRLRDAETLYGEALDISRRVLGPDHPDTVRLMDSLGAACSSQGRFREAETIHREGLAISRRVLGPDHPDTIRAMANLAMAISGQQRLREAEEILAGELAISRRVLGPDHPDTLMTIYNLGCIAARRGDRATALRYLGEAVDRGFATSQLMEEPDLTPLHGDPEFEALVKRAAKPPKAAAAKK